MTSNPALSLYSILVAGALVAASLAVPAQALTRQECQAIGSTIHETGSEAGRPSVWTCCANGNQNCHDCDGESHGGDNCVERPGPVKKVSPAKPPQPTPPKSTGGTGPTKPGQIKGFNPQPDPPGKAKKQQ